MGGRGEIEDGDSGHCSPWSLGKGEGCLVLPEERDLEDTQECVYWGPRRGVEIVEGWC